MNETTEWAEKDSTDEENFSEAASSKGNEESPVSETPVSMQDIAHQLDSLLQAVSGLKECFDLKIKTDAHKNDLFDKMHKELTAYQNGMMDKIVETMAMDIIQLADSTGSFYRVYEAKEPTEENYKRLLQIVKGISQDLSDVLYRQNIESYQVPGHEVDPRRQKVIQMVETLEADKNNLIAARTAVGYERNGKVLRPERVKIFKYTAMSDKKEM